MDDTNTVPTMNLDNTQPPQLTPMNQPQKPKKRHVFAWLKYHHSRLSKKQKILVGLLLFVLIVGGATGSYFAYKHFHKSPQTVTSKGKVQTKPTTEASHLTGVQIDPALNKRPVTGIMIENSPDARPQSGLKDAGVVFEAIAEGGITRFLALFQEAQPDYIGPVRSVRPYYLDWLLPFDAAVAHIGGAPQALSDIKSLGVKDLDQFANAGAYWRITQRYAPHNVYTSFAMLDALNKSKGFNGSKFTGFTRKKEAVAATPTAKTIDVNVSNSALYSSHYDYVAATNSYNRSEGGAAHIDEKSGAQLAPKVVIAMVISRGIDGDGQHTDYGTTTGGKVYVFQDGVMTEGTWAKSDRKAQFTFLTATGTPLKLNPGQTWITMIDAPTSVTYKP